MSLKRVVLKDEPVSSDNFSGEAHTRTAKALKNAILDNSNTNKDIAIGLNGAWGSGKSSVVEITREQLATPNEKQSQLKFHFFTYDIWKSQGTDFRRSFLEHFVDWSKNSFPKKIKKLDIIEDSIKSKKRETRTNSNIIMSWFGIVIIISLFFLPIYISFFKNFLKEEEHYYNFFQYPIGWITIFYLILTALSVGCTYTSYEFRNYRKSNIKDERENGSFKAAFSRTVLLFSKQHANQSTTQSIRDFDPTDYEFQHIFRSIVSVVQDNKNKIVVILDNIDRLPKDEISDYWAQMRSVFSNKVISTLEPYNGVSFITPFDQSHIVSKSEHKNTQLNDDNLKTKYITQQIAETELISKTFDLVFDVAPPILPDAKDFFIRKFNEAFSNIIPGNDIIKCYIIYDKHHRENKFNITPRNIIFFINQLSELYFIHAENIDIKSVAIYLLDRNNFENNIYELIYKDINEIRYASIANNKLLKQEIAALIYNVDSSVAYEILLYNQIKGAVTDTASSSKLINLAKNSSFDVSLYNAVQDFSDEWKQAGEIPTIISNFSDLKDNCNFDLTLIGNELMDSLTSCDLDLEEIENIAKIYEVISEDKFEYISRYIIKKCLYELPKESEEPSNSVEYGHISGKTIKYLYLHLNKFNKEALLKEIIKGENLKLSSQGIWNFLIITNDCPIDFTDFKKIIFDKDELGEFIKHEIETADDLDATKENIDRLFNQHIIDEKIATLLSEFVGNILISDDIDEGTFISAFGILNIFSVKYLFNDEYEFEIDSLYGNEKFFDNLFKYHSANDDVLVYAIYLISKKYLSAGIPILNKDSYNWFVSLLTQENSVFNNVIKRLSDQIYSADSVTLWLNTNLQSPYRVSINKLIKLLFTSSMLPDISFETFIGRYSFIKELLSSDFANILNHYPYSQMNGYPDKITLENCPTGFISDISSCENQAWKPALTKLRTELELYNANDLFIEILEGNYIFGILVELINTDNFSIKNIEEYRDKFVGFISDIINGDMIIKNVSESYDVLINMFDADYHDDILRKIRSQVKEFANGGAQILISCMPILFNKILSQGMFTAEAKNIIVRDCLCGALENNNEAIISIFLDIPKLKIRDFIKKSDGSTMKKLEAATKHFRKNFDDKYGVVGHIIGQPKKGFIEKFFRKLN